MNNAINNFFKYIVSENECEDRASDLKQLPTTSRTSMIISELCEYIRPKIVNNVDLYSDLYHGDPLFKEQTVIKDLVKDLVTGKH